MVTRPLGPTDPHRAGPYRLLAELGRGGMGRVLLGVAPDGRLAAVKQVHARLAADEGFRARFRREVAASRRVSGACTAAVLDADTEAATPWLASVFVAGPSLGAAVERSDALPAETVRRLAVGLAAALDEIHRAGLIHRDLKPDNVLLSEDGVRVIDLGIARAAESGNLTELTGTGLVVGSPAFMSPEQAEGRELTPASDVFSLGSVLVLAATGKSPFAGPSPLQELYSVVHTEPPLDAVPVELRGLVAACLAKNPAGRPTPAQLLADLGPVTPVAHPWPPAVRAAIAEQRAGVDRLLAKDPAPEPVTVPPRPDALTAVVTQLSTPAGTASPRRRRWIRDWAAAAAALGVLGAGAWWFVRTDGPTDQYLRMPTCAEAAPKLPLPEQRTDRDDLTSSLETTCSWQKKDPLKPDSWDVFPFAKVSWNLRRSYKSQSAAALQKELFEQGERSATGLAFADEAYWNSSPSPGSGCALSVRADNLIVSVALWDEPQPSNCEQKAIRIAEAAVDATPTQ
ncbi:serine/threonine-protein kinase [Streptomyces cyaneofuscatus]